MKLLQTAFKSILSSLNNLPKIILLSIMSSMIFASPLEDVTQNLNKVVSKINELNSTLKGHKQQKEDLDLAIKASEIAISKSQGALIKLKQQRETDINQIARLQSLLGSLTQDLNGIESSVNVSINAVYLKMKELQSSSSIINSNNQLNVERHKVYYLTILKTQLGQYQALKSKVEELKSLSVRLQAEVNRLDDKMGKAITFEERLKVARESQIRQSSYLQSQISKDITTLSNLKAMQYQLNKVIANLNRSRLKQKVAKSSMHATGAPDMDYEDNSPFFERPHMAPLKSAIKLEFGAMRNGTRNNGVLFQADDANVYAVSRGRVVYVGELPTFGKMIVVDHGDKYMSIYAGIIPKVSLNTLVKDGMVIASSGSSSNQPMGGVYFELRHLGMPVNPMALFKRD